MNRRLLLQRARAIEGMGTLSNESSSCYKGQGQYRGWGPCQMNRRPVTKGKGDRGWGPCQMNHRLLLQRARAIEGMGTLSNESSYHVTKGKGHRGDGDPVK